MADELDAAKGYVEELRDTGSVTNFPVHRPRSPSADEATSSKRFCAHHRSAGHHYSADHAIPDEEHQVLHVSGWVPEAPLDWGVLAATVTRKESVGAERARLEP